MSEYSDTKTYFQLTCIKLIIINEELTINNQSTRIIIIKSNIAYLIHQGKPNYDKINKTK